jgi:hypothetical protein
MASKKEETKKKTTKTEKKETTKKSTTKKDTTMDKQIKAAFKESLPKNFVETRNLTLYGSKDGKPVNQPIIARKELPVVKTKSGDLRIDADQDIINKVIDTNYQAAQTKKKQGNSTKKTTSSSTKKSNTASSKKTTKKTAEPARSLTTSRFPTTENAIKKTNLTNSLLNYRQGPIRVNRVDLQDSQQRMKFVEPALKLPSRPYDFVEHSRKTIEKKFQDTYSRNNIVPDSFSINDFYKWANDHNFEPRMNGSMQVYYTPKYEGAVLGFGGKKLTTEQDERDFEVLKALAENNERRKINAGKNKAYDRFLSTMDVLTLGGSTMIHDARAKNEYQKSGLNPKNFIGYEDIIKKPINTEKIGTTAMNAVNAGSSSAAKSFAAGLDFIMPTDFLGDYDWFSYVNRRFGEDQEAYSAAMMQSAKGNKALEIGGQVLMGVTAALPHALLAMMSGGLSAIGGVAQQAGNGTAAAIKAVTTSMAKNPLYWSSFLSNVGIEYEDAINNGADEKTASISAVLVAMINSGIEIGSGIEMLPKEIMKGNGRNLWKLVKSSIEEGGEEVFQGMISRGMAKIMYDSEREVFSIKTEDAVINPLTSAKEFGMGTVVGAFLGGGPALGSMIIDAGKNVTAKNLKKDGSRMGIVRELYRNGFNETNNNADVATAEAIIKMANNTASEADIELVGRSDAAKNIVQILANDKKAAQAVKDANAVNKKERTLQKSNQKNTEGNVIKNETVKDSTPKAEIPKNNVSNKGAVSIAKEMGNRIGKKVIIVPEKITSFLDGENGRQPVAEQNKTLFVDEKRLNEEYDAFYELGKKGVPFEEIPDDIETVILDEQAARAAYEAGQSAEIKEKPKSMEKESTVIKATEKQKGMIVQNAEAEQMKKMQPKAYSNIEHMAKNLGVNVTLVSELTNSKGQKLDGEITKNGIKLNVNADDPIRYVTTHEFGHRMKQLDEKGWKTYQDYVVKYWQKQGDYDVKMQALSEAYDGEMSIDELHEELACDFGEEMFKSEAVLTDFIKKDRTLAEKIKDVWFKVLSAFSDKARLRHAQNLWAKCYNNAITEAEGKSSNFDGKKLRIGYTTNGTQVVMLENDIFNENKENKKPHQFIANYIAENIGEFYKITESGQRVYIGEELPNEYTQSEYTKQLLKRNKKILNAKNQSVQSLGEIIEIATERSWDKNRKLKHNTGAKYGFYKYSSKIALPKYDSQRKIIGSNLFDIELVIRNDANGRKYLYDIQKIEKSAEQLSSTWRTKSDIEDSALFTNDSVTQRNITVNSNSMQNGKNNASKSKISGVKAVEEKISARKLEEENKRLREQIENMHIQLNQAEGKGLDLKSIKAAARRIKETYHSTIPLSTIHQELSRIYTAMSSGDVDGDAIKKIAELSDRMIESAIVKNDERSLMYGELLDRIKNTKIALTENEKAELHDNYKIPKIADNGVPIEILWNELVEEYSWYFDENLTGVAERIDKINEIWEELQPIYENYYGEEGNIAIAKTALANDIMESFSSIPENDGGTKYVFYDKRAAQAETALKKAEEKYKETLNKLERKYGKEIEKAKKDRDSVKERYSEKELKRSIDRDFNYLNTMLTKPTDSRHVPEEMRGSVAYLLSLFDFETKRSDALRDEGTDKPSVKAVKLAEMADAYEKIMRETFGVTGVQNENNIMFDKVLAEDIAELKAEIDSSETGKFKRIEDMSLSELQTAQKIIRGIHHMVTNKNKAFSNGIKENIHDLGIAVIKESADERKSRSSKRNIEGDRKEWGEGKPQTIRTLLNTLDNLVNYDNLAAYDFFHRIGGTMETLYRELRKGFNKHVWNIKEAHEKISDIMGKTMVDKWTGNEAKAQEFTTASGKIRLTPAQVMSLYALSKRKSAQEHLYLGGIQVGHNVAKTGKLKKENIGSAKTYKVTNEDLARMFETLSDEQKRIVDDIVKFMTETCSEWGNETSMKLYGYKKFGESYYFPMNVAKSSLPQSFESRGSKKIKNAGMTKKLTKGAKNPLVINDFFDVVTEHISTMSLYNTQVFPTLDMERVLNYSRWELAQDEEGLHSEYGSSVREEFVRTWGEKADQYIKKLIGDINGDKRTEKSPLDSMLNTAKKVSVAANTRVFLQQFTAVNRALNYINPIDFVGVFKKDNSKKMLKYSAIAYWKNLGFYDINVGKSMKQILFEKTPAIDTVTLEPYGWADKVSWSAIWGACEQEIKRKTDLEVGSEEFYEKVAEKFDYVIDRSQVVDSVFHRTQSMRSTNAFAKVSTAYMAEPLKELNMTRTDILDAVRNGKKIKTLPRLLTIYTTSAALQALAQLVPDMARKSPEKWYDEDDEKIDTKEMWLKEILQNFTDSLNPITKMPYISDIYEIYKGYTQERFELAQITDIINSLKPKTLYDTKKAPWQRVWNVISAIAMAKGVPTNGIMREFKSYGSSLFRIKDGTEYGDYIITKLDYNVKNPDNKNKFMKFYNAAVKAGHSEAAVMIMDDYIASNLKEYKKNKDAAKAAKKLIKTSEKADEKSLMYQLPSKNITIGETQYELEGKEYFEYASSASNKLWQLALEVANEKEFKELDAKYQYEALEKTKSYAQALAKKEKFPEYELPNWMKKIQEGDTTIIDELQDSIAADEKAKIGSKLYKAAQKSDEEYDKLLKEYEDKFGVDYMVGAITEEMKNTDEYKKDPEKYKKEVADDYLIDALLEVASETPEYKEDLAKYNKEIVIDQSKLSKTAVSKAKELRKEAAKYYATKENFSKYEGEGNFKKYDDMLKGKMDINEYISFMAQIYDYKKALGKSSLKKAETVSFINRYNYPQEVKRNLFKITMPNIKNIPY